jgi:hypothetical protein
LADQPHGYFGHNRPGDRRGPRKPSAAAAFADDPDCWLVASIEDHDLESGLAQMGPIFRERAITPPAAPLCIQVTVMRSRSPPLVYVAPPHMFNRFVWRLRCG